MPIIFMAYTATGTLTDFGSALQVRELLTANGWTWVTAACTVLFSLMPVSYTHLDVYKRQPRKSASGCPGNNPQHFLLRDTS